MSSDLQPYVAIALTMLLCSGLVFAILVMNAILGPKRHNPVKDTAFECGNLPADTPRKRIPVQFSLVAILFLVFDLETVLIIPWAVVYRDLLRSPLFGPIALIEALIFVFVLAVGLAWVWGRGALDWAPGPRRNGGRDA